MKEIIKGQLVRVGKDVGAVIYLEGENDTPSEHVAIWYGEVDADGQPKCKTVPIEYCIPVERVLMYH